MRNTGLDEAQAGIKITRRNINNLRYADDTTLMAESEEELKSFLKMSLKLCESLKITKNWYEQDSQTQEATVRTRHDLEQQTGSKSGKEYVKAVCCHPAYLTYMQSTS